MRLEPDTLQQVLKHRIRSLPSRPLAPAGGLRFHSDRVRPGDVFVAMAGAQQHGERYADDALARGAAYLISDRPHPDALLVDDAAEALLDLGRFARAAHHGPVIGVTGSVGKTTTKTLLAAAADAHVSPGNMNTPYALATVLVDVWLRQQPHRPLVLEMGIDHLGEMATLIDLVRPSHGLLTAISPAHLAGLGDLEALSDEKSLLLAATDHRYASEGAYRHLPQQRRAGVRRYRLLEADESVEAGEGPGGADAGQDGGTWLGEHRAGGDGDELIVASGEGPIRLRLPGLGRALAEDALGALRLAHELGVPLADAARRIEGCVMEEGRMRPHRLGGLLLLDDAYNASPASMAAALEVLVRSPAPRMAVVGTMLELGDGSPGLHREVGRSFAAAGLDTLWVVGEGAAELAAAFPGSRRFDRIEEVIAAAGELPDRGSLLVKGSLGMRMQTLVRHLLAVPA